MKKILTQIAPFEIILTLVMLGLHLYAALADDYAFPNNWFVRDDAYYYFKVAQNISEGNGSTFDGINITNGYHPLWMLFCIPIFALARFDLILPLRVLLMTIAGIHAATAILLYRLIKRHLSHVVAIAASVFWAFNPYIHATVYKLGLETPIAAFSVALVIYALSTFEQTWRKEKIPLKKFAWLGFLAALAMFSRLDLVFFAAIAGIWLVFRGTLMRHLITLDLAIIFISMTSAVLLRTDFHTYNITYASSAIEAAIIAVIIKLIALFFFGAYQPLRAQPLWKTLRKILFALAISAALVAGIYILIAQMGLGKNFPRSAFLLDFVISLILICASRLTAYWCSSPNRIHAGESPLAQFRSKWKTWLAEGLSFYSVLGGLLAMYMVFSHVAFGASSPVSGQIKRWWGSMAESAYERPAASWSSYFGMDEAAFETGRPFTDAFWSISEFMRPIIPGADMQNERFFLAAGMGFVFWLGLVLVNKKRAVHVSAKLGFIPLFAGSVIHILSYTATSYGGAKEWYWVSQMLLLTFAFSLMFDLLTRPLLKLRALRYALIGLALLYGFISANQFWKFVEYAMPHGVFAKDRPYMEVIAYLEANTFENEIIGMTGGGNVGYFIKNRTIVNMDGLINSYEYFRALQNREAATYLRKRGMTVIFANPRLLDLPPYYGQFAPYLERYNSYGGKDLLYLLEEPKY
ncbi:MAG: glycosyltransferase family 39 protein [Chloroflexi bacterium]|nr:glycosyltransferase family 39 protein [Chloroflexota bacterium]